MICAICREQFKDYMEHIFSVKHKRGVQTWNSIFNEIDKVVNELNDGNFAKRMIKINPEEEGMESSETTTGITIDLDSSEQP